MSKINLSCAFTRVLESGNVINPSCRLLFECKKKIPKAVARYMEAQGKNLASICNNMLYTEPFFYFPYGGNKTDGYNLAREPHGTPESAVSFNGGSTEDGRTIVDLDKCPQLLYVSESWADYIAPSLRENFILVDGSVSKEIQELCDYVVAEWKATSIDVKDMIDSIPNGTIGLMHLATNGTHVVSLLHKRQSVMAMLTCTTQGCVYQCMIAIRDDHDNWIIRSLVMSEEDGTMHPLAFDKFELEAVYVGMAYAMQSYMPIIDAHCKLIRPNCSITSGVTQIKNDTKLNIKYIN